LAEENDIIIIYPTWWINVPAVLKGWYDRVLTAKFAFQYNYKGIPEGLLTGKRAFVVSTGGAPTWLHRFGKGFRSLKVTTSDTLNFCGIKTKTCFIGSCTQITDEKRSVIDATVNHAFRKWL
jgi:NAD(P)H dehydrogenase (quinone)